MEFGTEETISYHKTNNLAWFNLMLQEISKIFLNANHSLWFPISRMNPNQILFYHTTKQTEFHYSEFNYMKESFLAYVNLLLNFIVFWEIFFKLVWKYDRRGIIMQKLCYGITIKTITVLLSKKLEKSSILQKSWK